MKKKETHYNYRAFERAHIATSGDLETLRIVVTKTTNAESKAPNSGRSKIASKPTGRMVRAGVTRSSQ